MPATVRRFAAATTGRAMGNATDADALTFSASIAQVGGAIRWNGGKNGGRILLEIPESDAPALSWLAATAREAELTVTIRIVDAAAALGNG